MATSHFQQFLEQATITEPDTDCPLSADSLYGLYTSWCIINGLDAESDSTFRTAMGHCGVDLNDSRLRMVGPAAADYILSSYPAAA